MAFLRITMLCLAVVSVAAETPLDKVVRLITEMKAQTEKEAKEDQVAYDKYACWCTTTEQEKTDAISAAEKKLEELTAQVQGAEARRGQLETEVAQLDVDIKEDTEALETAEALRKEEKTAFETEEKDMEETIVALKQAVAVLKKVQLAQTHGGVAPAPLVREARQASDALLQVRESVQHRMPNFHDVMQRDVFDFFGSLSAAEHPQEGGGRFLSALQQPTGAAAGAKSYNSRSGGIFGILSEMLSQFERDLSNAQEKEAAAVASFAKLQAAKRGEIKAATKQKQQKEEELGNLAAKTAQAKKDIVMLTKANEDDSAFLADMKAGCTDQDNEYKARVEVRTEEIRALAETLKILREDDARDLFGKTMSFLQHESMSAAQQDQAAERAMRRLVAAGKHTGNIALTSLAVRVRLDSFGKVKAMCDEMVTRLKEQQKDEDAKRESCRGSIDKTEDDITAKNNEAEDLDEKQKQITNAISELTESIETLQTQVSEAEVSLKQLGENRKAQNKQFQQEIADHRATTNILKKALARLNQFYAGGSLVQVHAHQANTPGRAANNPPPKPKGYEKSGGAGGVTQILQKIISESEQAEVLAEKGEQAAQKEYATAVKDITKDIEDRRAEIDSKKGDLAAAEADKAQTAEAQSATKTDIEELTKVLGAHHEDCDWLLNNYDARKGARAEEIQAIQDAKAILSGADFGDDDE